jgi:DNA helicase-2/ATP-dependent DNA helicase PcrA
VAVLYRTRRQATAIAAALAERGLPSRVRAHAAALAAEDSGLPAARAPDGGRGVLLATIHAAQGGEWPVVFVAGVEEGLLPHARALAGRGRDPAAAPRPEEAVAEELRVAFVAATRPRALLYLSHCRVRSAGDRDGPPTPRRPSRFLGLLPVPPAAGPGEAPSRPAEAPRWLP